MGNKATKKNVPTELSDEQIAVLKANTKYTEEEIREWHAGFLRDCPNGKLDKKKFIEVYQQFYPNGKADNYCKYAFQTFDRDKNGTIDFEEFLLSIAATTHDSLARRLEMAFNLYDFSKDGLIDQKELATIISAIYDLVGQKDRKGDRDPNKCAADIIAALDVTGDKKINKQEFIAGCRLDERIQRLLAPDIDLKSIKW